MKRLFFFMISCALIVSSASAQLTSLPFTVNDNKLVGLWEFKTQADAFKATKGEDLTPTLITAEDWVEVDGIPTIRINKPESNAAADQRGLAVEHGIAANGGSETHVNNYSIVFDVKVDATSGGGQNLISLFRPGTSGDGRAFLGFDTKRMGLTSYTPNAILLGEWNRFILNVNIEKSTYHMYAIHPDGTITKNLSLNKTNVPLTADGMIEFFGDEDGENGRLNVAKIALFNDFLNAEELEGLGVSAFKASPESLSFGFTQIETAMGRAIDVVFTDLPEGTSDFVEITIPDEYKDVLLVSDEKAMFSLDEDGETRSAKTTFFFYPTEVDKQYSFSVTAKNGTKEIVFKVTGTGAVNFIDIDTNAWYRIQFDQRTGHCLTDNGAGEIITSTTPNLENESQLWQFQFIELDENEVKQYKIVSKAGNHIDYDYELDRFISTTSSNNTFTFDMRKNDAGWQIKWNEYEYKTSSGSTNYGGYINKVNGDDQFVGYYYIPDAGSSIVLYKEDEEVDLGLPKFSTETEEYWYHIQFVRRASTKKIVKSTALPYDGIENFDFVTQTLDTIPEDTDLFLWKIVGDTTECTIVDVNGFEWKLVDGFIGAVESGEGDIFKFKQYGGKTWALYEEINSQYINDNAGSKIGFWSLDAGGEINFIPYIPSSIDAPSVTTDNANDPVVSTTYYTIDGVLLGNKPNNVGIYIEKNIRKSGKAFAVKVFVTK
ncbi:hypothetical protein M2138_000375 [Dysgonomonadaceae bacterium PH5-43]|nr:hypothetical protein [Dysgonomonadaceae bacterium PH5-43]